MNFLIEGNIIITSVQDTIYIATTNVKWYNHIIINLPSILIAFGILILAIFTYKWRIKADKEIIEMQRKNLELSIFPLAQIDIWNLFSKSKIILRNLGPGIMLVKSYKVFNRNGDFKYSIHEWLNEIISNPLDFEKYFESYGYRSDSEFWLNSGGEIVLFEINDRENILSKKPMGNKNPFQFPIFKEMVWAILKDLELEINYENIRGEKCDTKRVKLKTFETRLYLSKMSKSDNE